MSAAKLSVLLILIFIFIGMLIGYQVFRWFDTPEEQIELKDGPIMMEGRYLMAISPVSFPTIQTLAVASSIIECESQGNHYNTDGTILRGPCGEYGVAQFMPETWDWFNELRGTNLNILDKDDQLNMLYWAIESGLAEHWVCYKPN